MATEGNPEGCKINENRLIYYATNVRELLDTENKENNCQNFIPKTEYKIAFFEKAVKIYGLEEINILKSENYGRTNV